VFHLDVVKADLDVAYIAMAIHIFQMYFQMFQLFQTYVASVFFKCFSCFRRMLQVFYLDVAKVYLNVAYVVMTIQICSKRILKMLQW
jgi:hypothetical protein